MASAAIELQNVKVVLQGETLLQNVNLKVLSGESLVLIGPSGQGKSVLLKVMGGLILPTEGRVLIEGQDLSTLRGKTREKLLRRIGMLFQKNALFDSLTVGENVAFPLEEVAHSTSQEIEEAISFFLDAVGISHARALFPDEISGGMQKRLGIARALALKPEIVFYDDPTAGLDPITSRKIIQLILDMKMKSKATMVSITNDMQRAYQMAGTIAMVVDKSVIVTGNKDQTINHKDPRVFQFVRGQLDGPLTVQP